MDRQVEITEKVNGSTYCAFLMNDWHYNFEIVDGTITMAEGEGARYDMNASATYEFRYEACKEVLSQLLNKEMSSFERIYAKLSGYYKNIADNVISERIQEIEEFSETEIKRLRTIGK